MQVLEKLQELKLVPIITVDDPAAVVPVVDALIAGGLPCVEVTFRTAAAGEALRRISAERPALLIGAGTVLTVAQAAEARAAGARFILTPGFSAAVVDYCLEYELPVFPGVSTPTEIELALGRGLTTLKLFPAEALGGLAYLKAIAAPYGMVRFIPTGGINAANVRSYLDFNRVVACGGSWMAPAQWIGARDFERIREETVRAVAAVTHPSGVI